MSDTATIFGFIAFFAIIGNCTRTRHIEEKVDEQRVLMNQLLTECRADNVPELEVAEVEFVEPLPEDPCACPEGEVCMCQGTSNTTK